MLFGGNLYFNEETEFNLFCEYNGLHLKPYNKMEIELRNKKIINDNGFVKNSNAQKCSLSCQRSNGYQISPITKINDYIRNQKNLTYLLGSHLYQILFKVKKIKFDSK